jgi:hypothetical protein
MTHPAYNPLAHAYTPPPNGVVIEPSRGPWKNNIHWGNTVKQPMPASAGIEIPVFDGAEIVGPPRAQTIQLFRDDNRAGQNSDYRAHVYYGTGAAQNEFFCDWAQGQQFTIVANWVRVNAISYAPLGFVPYNPSGGAVAIGACIVEGTTAKGRPLTFTEQQQVVGNLDFTDGFPTPDFAKAVILHIENPGAVAMQPGIPSNVDLLTFASLSTYDRIDAVLCLPDGVTVPAPIRSAAGFNHSGQQQAITLQWILCL